MFVAGNWICRLSSGLTDVLNLLNVAEYDITCPRHLCYARNLHQLVVGHECQRPHGTAPGAALSIFDIKY